MSEAPEMVEEKIKGRFVPRGTSVLALLFLLKLLGFLSNCPLDLYQVVLDSEVWMTAMADFLSVNSSLLTSRLRCISRVDCPLYLPSQEY